MIQLKQKLKWKTQKNVNSFGEFVKKKKFKSVKL